MKDKIKNALFIVAYAIILSGFVIICYNAATSSSKHLEDRNDSDTKRILELERRVKAVEVDVHETVNERLINVEQDTLTIHERFMDHLKAK